MKLSPALPSKINLGLWGYLIFAVLYGLFSFSLTSPNLFLSQWPPFVQFQLWSWETFFNNRPLLTYSYVFVLGGLFLSYAAILSGLWNKSLLSLKNIVEKRWWLLLAILITFLLSNTALSYDVFNYIFNAKMVLVYGANPHLQTALEFSSDPWVRFMHNVHTPAPYGYGWTLLSLIPYSLGIGKFLPSLLAFKISSLLSLGLIFKLLSQKLPQKNLVSEFGLGILFFNPLLLVEVLGNAHNDLWMMAPALASVLILLKRRSGTQSAWGWMLISAALLLISIFIKLASVVLIPVWIGLLLYNLNFNFPFKKLFMNSWPLLSSLAFFVPLLTERSKLFLPWYLIWSLIWIPLIWQKKWKSKFWKVISQAWVGFLLLMSAAAMARYLPFLWQGTYDGTVPQLQLQIVWIPAAIYLVITSFLVLIKIKKS